MSSVFSNPAGGAKEAAAQYVQALLELLGNRDPLKVQEELYDAIVSEVTGLEEAALRHPEKPGKWSIMQVVQHLADSELVAGYRMRMILAHPNPPIQGYDQDAWANELRYNDVSLRDALEQLRVLRSLNLKLVRSLSKEQLAREGLHSERGPESVWKIVQMMAGHDLLHRNQIQRIKQSLGME
ncbi:DinB family protein [candidate division KSB1 bacterium]|nr:DinB family protein [candidate division KSB1 bacterium]